MSLWLEDDSGHLAGQTDDLLLSDTYVWERGWKTGQIGTTYHILPTLPAIAPGRYRLFLAVYDPRTMQRLPVLNANGTPAPPPPRLAPLT